jgi:hypothetical protein
MIRITKQAMPVHLSQVEGAGIPEVARPPLSACTGHFWSGYNVQAPCPEQEHLAEGIDGITCRLTGNGRRPETQTTPWRDIFRGQSDLKYNTTLRGDIFEAKLLEVFFVGLAANRNCACTEL